MSAPERFPAVVQDGADFYEHPSGRLLFTASIKVKDWDTAAASQARAEFLRNLEAGANSGAHSTRVEFVI